MTNKNAKIKQYGLQLEVICSSRFYSHLYAEWSAEEVVTKNHPHKNLEGSISYQKQETAPRPNI